MKTFLIPVWSARIHSAFYVSVLNFQANHGNGVGNKTRWNSRLVGNFFRAWAVHRLKCRKGLSWELHNIQMPIHVFCETDNLNANSKRRRNTFFYVIVKLIFPLFVKKYWITSEQSRFMASSLLIDTATMNYYIQFLHHPITIGWAINSLYIKTQ